MYGFLVGSMKVMNDMRNGKYDIVAMATDLIGATIIGYVAYEIASLSEISETMKVIWTLFLASNAFFVLSIITSKDLFLQFIEKYLKK